MRRSCLHVALGLLLVSNLIASGHSEGVDTDFCDVNAIKVAPGNLPSPKFKLESRYQAAFEKNIDKVTRDGVVKDSTTETVEYYDGVKNIGVAISVFSGMEVRTYSFYDENELLVVFDDTCSAFPNNESFDWSPFYMIANENGKIVIASMLTLLLGSDDINLVYIGSKNYIRGIPVNEWQTCIYSTKEKKTKRVTISYSNPKYWHPAAASRRITDFETIPVQIQFDCKKDDGELETEFFTITKFRPFLELEEEDYAVPEGVNCKDRRITKPLPNIPPFFSYNVQVVQPKENSASKEGKAQYYKVEYNSHMKIFKHTYNVNNSVVTEMQDFNTGINYVFFESVNSCEMLFIPSDSVSVDDKNKEHLQMKDPLSFFDLKDISYSYVGLKRVDGVNTDVWSGRKSINNGITVLQEWYFLSTEWKNEDSVDQKYKTPIFLKQTFEYWNEQMKIVRKEEKFHHFFNYRTQYSELQPYDLSQCAGQQEKKIFFVKFASSYGELLRRNLVQFQKSFITHIANISQVTIMRVTNVNVILSNYSTFVSFDLYQRVKRYGDVEAPMYDKTLQDAKENLENYFAKNEFRLHFKTLTNETVEIVAFKNSLEESYHKDNGDNYVTIVIHNYGYSSLSVAVVSIIAVIVGYLASMIVMVLLKNNKVNFKC